MIGRTILHYQIIETLGRGGMGVVYKARDTHLDRFVAIKVLSPEKLADEDRTRRFVQEAKSASALNHPNIIHIYDIADADGIQFIAMEYVLGKTLDQLITRKGLRLNETLKYAIQIADALARAHAAGIIHRDLKPSNLMVDDHGLVKVLDFGLAKLTESATSEFAETATITAGEDPRTEEGTIVGTVAYMSPEQAEGKLVDARSDIFAFGSVLYEIVTGSRAFHGDSKLSTLSAILKQDPEPASGIVPDVPRDLEKIISRCLRKDVARRFQHMDDVKVALEELKEDSESGKLVPPATAPSAWRSWQGWALPATALLLLAAVAVGYWFLRPASHTTPRIVPLTSYLGFQCCATFSPDGNQVAFVWDGPKHENKDIYVKLIGTESTLRLTSGPAAHSNPAWSPDGRYIAFVRFFLPNKFGVFLVPAIGGPDRKLAEIDSGSTLSWSPNGNWLAVTDQARVILLSVSTGEKRKLTIPPPENSDDSPAFSPDGRSLVFSRNSGSGISEIYFLALATDLAPKGQPKQLTFKRQLSKMPIWTADGREVIFSSWGPGLVEPELLRMPVASGKPPQPLFVSAQGWDPAISRRGDRLAFTRVSARRNIRRIEVGRSRNTVSVPVNLISSTYSEEAPQYSPDGKSIAFTSSRTGSFEVWVSASDGSNPQQLTSLGMAGSPRWSPDGQWIVFDSSVEGQSEIYIVEAGGGRPRRMTNHSADDAVGSWSRDGRWLYFVSDRTKEWQIWKMPAEGGEAVQVTQHGGHVAFESLDGKVVFFSKDVWLSSIWKVPVNGGKEEKVQESVLGQAFAVARKGIYFASPHFDGSSAIDFHSFESGKLTNIATIRSTASVFVAGWGMSVSPDERYLLYTQFDQSSSNLMLVENFH